MKRLFSKKAVVVGLAAGLSLGVVGTALAYFTSTGSGSGSATVGNSSQLSVTQDAFGSGSGQQPAVTLYPGAGVQGINFTITNNGGGNEYVNQVTASVADDGSGNAENASDSSSINGCKVSWFQVNNATQTVGQDINGSGGTYDYTSGNLSVQLLDDSTHPQDACAGKTIKLSFSSN